MTPEKLFIPTTTLNFNNIMSSESISPAKFYERRGFGYKRFYKVLPNSLSNRIVIYEKYPLFDIQDEELESYPMVIEVNTRHLTEGILKKRDGFYFCDETIYLNPFTTKIFFRSEDEKRRTLSKSDQGIESKMVSLYENCFLLRADNIESANLIAIATEDSTEDASNYISKDKRTNKIKGFIYAYLLAANRSLSTDVVLLKRSVKELRNVLSAIIAGPNSLATFQQNKQLESLYKSINSTFSKTEGLQEKLDLRIQQMAEKYDCKGLSSFLEGEGGMKWFADKQGIKESYKVEPFRNYSSVQTNPEIFESYIYRIEQQISEIASNQKRSNISSSILPTLINGRISEIPRQKEFLIKLFNRFLEEAFNGNELIQSRYEFAKAGGVVFKEELKDKWEKSEWQNYINALLQNLNEYSPFDINNVDNLTLKSFAAFCQKGELDIDKLEDYLISNGIGDFRIAFGLWGAVFGFANMPKTLTNDLFLSEDLDYVSELYIYIFRQVHGVEIEGLLKKATKNSPLAPAKMNYHSTDGDNTPEQLQGQLATFSEYEKMDEETKSEVTGKLYENGIRSLNMWDGKIASSITWDKAKGQKGLIKAISNLKKKKINPPQLSMHISSAQSNTANYLNKSNTPPLDWEFYKDKNAWRQIENIIPEDHKRKVEKQIEWIQKQYQEGGEYASKNLSNKSVIEHFYNHSRKPWPNGQGPKIEYDLLEQIVAKLRELYP